MPKKPHVSLRINVTPELFGQIGEFRHTARIESRGAAMVTLLNAGLRALAKPVELPHPAEKVVPAGNDLPPARPKLVGFAGKERDHRASRTTADA